MKQRDKDLLLVSIFTFFTVFLWIFFELVKTVKTTTITPATQAVVKPFSPILNRDLFTILEQKKVY